MQQLSSKSEL